MVMQVSSVPLQEMLDRWDHMFRYGLNVPKYFLIHDDVSFADIFREWVPDNDIEKLKMLRFERDEDEEPTRLASSIDTLSKSITSEDVRDYYYLAMPHIDENDFILSGWVKSPGPDEFDMSFGFREDHRIPYEDDSEFPCKIINVDSRQSIPHTSHYFEDVRRIACGFPYPACRMTWSVTSSRVGRNNAHLCFWDYEVDERYIRD